MKKILAFILALIFVLSFTGCAFVEDLSLLYDHYEYADNFCFGVNDTAGCCFAGAYNCREYTYGMEITIPDEYNGKPVKRIGGYFGRGYPTPFYFEIGEWCETTAHTEYDADLSTIDEAGNIIADLPYVLNIGKNIDSVVYVENHLYPCTMEDGSIVFYHPVVSINCSEENRTFYSENGRLYNRKDNTLVSDFDYKD